MNELQPTANDIATNSVVPHLLLTEGWKELMPKNPAEFVEQILLRATFVGPVLDGILHDPHVHVHAEYAD